MANREEGAAVPNWRQGQNQQQDQQQNQDAAGQQHIHINWSNFKPEFSGKPEEDVEAHLLHSNYWMNAHHFNEDIKVQRFCLTMLGEARLWFQSLELLDDRTWPQFLCVMWIRQVATLLGYGEPQILEVFKNTLPTKLYWVLFPIEDLRQAVETAKRILTKEKLDKQLTGQSSARQFMNVRDGTERKVSFNTRDKLGDKIDKLAVVMSRLAAKDNHEKRPFKPQIYKSRGQNRSYNQGSYHNRPDSRNRRQYPSSGP